MAKITQNIEVRSDQKKKIKKKTGVK